MTIPLLILLNKTFPNWILKTLIGPQDSGDLNILSSAYFNRFHRWHFFRRWANSVWIPGPSKQQFWAVNLSSSHQTPGRLITSQLPRSCRVIVFEAQKQLWPDALPGVTNDFHRFGPRTCGLPAQCSNHKATATPNWTVNMSLKKIFYCFFIWGNRMNDLMIRQPGVRGRRWAGRETSISMKELLCLWTH